MLHYSTVGQKHTLTKSLGSETILGMHKETEITDINEYREQKRRQRLADNGHVSVGFVDDFLGDIPTVKVSPCQGFSGVSRGVVLDDGSLTAFVCSQCGESVCKGALHSDKVR